MENEKTRSLTPAQRRLYAKLVELEQQGAAPPSLPELCLHLGVRSRGSLHKQLSALIEADLVKPMNGLSRGVQLRHPTSSDGKMPITDGALLQISQVPLLGRIAAGRPIEARLDNETVAVPNQLLPAGNAYVLEVRGDSMVEAGIFDGDFVVIDSDREPKRGDIVVALVDGVEATLKRLGRLGPPIVLEAANPDYPPQILDPGRVQLQGVLHGLLRRY